MNHSTTVSVIVPCYKQAQYLSEALQSILNQTYSNWECIIVDDDSPDNTAVVAGEWCQKDTRFKYLKKENGGPSETRNVGIRQAQGEYILPLDADDKVSEKYMEEAVSILQADEQVKLVYSQARYFGAKNKQWRLAPYQYKDLLIKNMIFSSCFYRKKDFDKTNGYDPDMRMGWEDWEFLIRFLQPEDRVIRIEKCHFFYRIKEDSRQRSITSEIEKKLYLQLFNKHQAIYLQYLNPIKDYRETFFKQERKRRSRKKFFSRWFPFLNFTYLCRFTQTKNS